MITTLLPPSAGSARVAGFDVVRQAGEVRRRIGYVSQMLSADGGLTAEENLRLSAALTASHAATAPRGSAARSSSSALPRRRERW
jgi:ABC-2 type transport system ATP-binding protein